MAETVGRSLHYFFFSVAILESTQIQPQLLVVWIPSIDFTNMSDALLKGY